MFMPGDEGVAVFRGGRYHKQLADLIQTMFSCHTFEGPSQSQYHCDNPVSEH